MGQVAHVDKNRSNDAKDNLVFLCMEHHTLYDSKTSQHKNYTPQEVKEARTRLYNAIADGQHHDAATARSEHSFGSDRRQLAALIQLMTTTGSIDFLRDRHFAGWSFEWDRLEGVEIVAVRTGPEHEFLDEKLEGLRSQFRDACKHLITTMATNTGPIGLRGDRQAVPEQLERDNPDLFKERVREIHSACDNLCESYDRLVRTARRALEN